MLPPSSPSETVTLPIRVYAPNGADAHVEPITLQVDDPAGVDSLYVQAHQPFYHRGGNEKGPHEGADVEGAASIQINDGSWIDVRNETVDCARPERFYAQCIGGAFSTVRFTLPAPNVQTGLNRIRFRFNGTDGVRSGYRVLGVGFMRASDPSVETFNPNIHGAHDGSLLRYEAPASWTAPDGHDAPGDVAKGQAWFERAALLEHPDGERIRATCSDCHAQDGRDLTYFNFSNRTIVARSRFHGLSEEQGRQIAAYIRSIPLEKRDGSAYEAPGTPWDPPYQPGPELMATGAHPDTSDQAYWAAGAGLHWVLNRDVDMLPYLFPDGQGGVDSYMTRNGDRALTWKHIHMDSTLNMRVLPLSVQFPDWNNWLPDMHPKDAFPSQWERSGARSVYEGSLHDALAAHGGATDRNSLFKIEHAIRDLHIGFNTSLKEAANEAVLPENQFELARLSNHQWLIVKVWESFHTHHLEDVADEMYGDHPMEPFEEPRSWMGAKRTLFNVGPHIAAPDGIRGIPPHLYGSMYMDQLLSHIWYQLQVTVNPGAGRSSTQNPVDWNYHNSFLKAAPRSGLRNIASHVKASQMLSNGYGVDGTGGRGFDRSGFVKGWEPFTIKPERFLLLRGDSRYSNLPFALREDLYTATLRAWNEFNMRFPVEEHPRGMDEFRYNPPDYVPKAWGHTNPRWHGQKIYQGLVQTGRQFPEAYGAMDTLAAWGAQMWPTTEGPAWADIVDYLPPGVGTPPSLRLTAPAPDAVVPGPDVTLRANVTDPDGTIEAVEYFLGDTQIGRVTSPPYDVRWTGLPPNTYVVHARARDAQNLIARDTLVVTVGPRELPRLDAPGLYYAYLEADWTQSAVPNFNVLVPIHGGTVSGFDLSKIGPRPKDFAVRFFGYLDVPDDGLYTFFTTSSDGSVLSINGQQVVDNDGRHPLRERSGMVSLPAGRHAIEVVYFMRGGQRGLGVSWAGPHFEKRPLADDHLYLTGPPASVSPQ